MRRDFFKSYLSSYIRSDNCAGDVLEMAKILVVEDNEEFAGILTTWLQSQNYVVDKVHTGEDALQLLSSFSYDLLILDWELPGIQGIGVCEKFRRKGGTTPVLFLTGKSDLSSKVTGLETGADDYLSKPFEFRELSARVRSLLRRPPGLVSNILKVGGLALNTDSHSVETGGKEISLTPREFSLLEFLMKHTNHAYSSKALLDSVWPLDSALSEDTVRSCMRSLRKKITAEGQECIIKTLAGYGYIIESDTQR